jgi:cation diffusion facilitator family transporter
MKAVAGILTGSAAMLAEAAPSVADTTTEGLLLAALRHSERPADRRHPFGYGKVRFFWSLIAAVSIFVTGAMFAVYEGVRTFFGAREELEPRVGGLPCAGIVVRDGGRVLDLGDAPDPPREGCSGP